MTLRKIAQAIGLISLSIFLCLQTADAARVKKVRGKKIYFTLTNLFDVYEGDTVSILYRGKRIGKARVTKVSTSVGYAKIISGRGKKGAKVKKSGFSGGSLYGKKKRKGRKKRRRSSSGSKKVFAGAFLGQALYGLNDPAQVESSWDNNGEVTITNPQSTIEDSSMAYSINIGYSLNKKMHLIFRYAQLGTETITTVGDESSTADDIVQIKEDITLSSLGADFRYNYFFGRNFSIFGLFGLFQWAMEFETQLTQQDGVIINNSVSESGTSYKLGIGAQYNLGSNFFTNLEFSSMYNIGTEQTVQQNVTLVGLNIGYYFF